MFFSAFGVWNPEKAPSHNISTKATSAIQRLDQDTLHSIFSFVSIEDLGRLGKKTFFSLIVRGFFYLAFELASTRTFTKSSRSRGSGLLRVKSNCL